MRCSGFALNDEELAYGLRSIAMPIRTQSGEVAAAVNLAAHRSMISVDDLVARLSPALRAPPTRSPRGSATERLVSPQSGIMIAGGGIGGLTAALALHARGIEARCSRPRGRCGRSASASTCCRTRCACSPSSGCWTSWPRGAIETARARATSIATASRSGASRAAARPATTSRSSRSPRRAAAAAASGRARAPRRRHRATRTRLADFESDGSDVIDASTARRPTGRDAAGRR